ncbi:Amino Acid-Polyamine-Organocation (APC) Family [Achlya hypogyna]|uniref:Amino Acid-Polyamine-Organocation (APC) Family n=1 Tax=Achlya hypogyna TaxID=1202772 RepID=A0A1V9ZKQ1_ACHHY|nr:Amino Acid-Polyamine-Organocation (APC) Family [Achlya hypogyna]
MFVGGFSSFFTTLPLATWFFVGIEALNTVCNAVENPRDVIPKGQIPCVITLFACSIFVFFVAVSQAPGAANLPSVVAVFNPGYMIMFDISADIAMLLSLPATFATIFGFILAYANILTALSHSRLLPGWVGQPHKRYHTQANALIFGSVLGYILCFCVTYSPALGAQLFNICMFFGSSAYIAQCAGYLYLKREFAHLPRRFRNPLGKAGVYYSGFVWVLTWISIVGYQGSSGFLLSCVGPMIVVLMLYYILYAKERQTFSEDERKILFFAHVAKSNAQKRKLKAKRKSYPRWIQLLLNAVDFARRLMAPRSKSLSTSVVPNSNSNSNSTSRIHSSSWLLWGSSRALFNSNRVVAIKKSSQRSSGPHMETAIRSASITKSPPKTIIKLATHSEAKMIVEEMS